MKHSDDGYTWLGRHPYIGLPALVVCIPLYVLVGAVLGVASIFTESWLYDFRDVVRRIVR